MCNVLFFLFFFFLVYNLWSDLANMIEVHKSTIPEDLPFIADTAEESF